MSLIPFGPEDIERNELRKALIRSGDAKSLKEENTLLLTPFLEPNWQDGVPEEGVNLILFPNMDGSYQIRGQLVWLGGTQSNTFTSVINLDFFLNPLEKSLAALKYPINMMAPDAVSPTRSESAVLTVASPILAVAAVSLQNGDFFTLDYRLYLLPN